MVTKNPQNVHRNYFWAILLTFIFNIKIDINICEPHYVNFFLWTSYIVFMFEFLIFDIFLTTWHLFDILTHQLNLNHLSLHRAIFRWFKFILKPPNSITSGNLLSAIWDTFHWNFFVKFGLKTAWHISCDILWSLLTHVNFWRLQGHLSTFAKIWGPSENQSFLDEGVISGRRGLEVLGGQITGLHDGTIFLGGATHLRGVGGHCKKKRHFSGHLRWLKGYSKLTHLTKNQSIGAA